MQGYVGHLFYLNTLTFDPAFSHIKGIMVCNIIMLIEGLYFGHVSLVSYYILLGSIVNFSIVETFSEFRVIIGV